MSGQGQITRLLADWSGGKQAALDSLVRIVYDELRRLASVYMRGERPDHLLQTTALVNEAYLCAWWNGRADARVRPGRSPIKRRPGARLCVRTASTLRP